MKNILVNGYFGINLGDDLFFKILFERYPEVNFTFFNNFYLPQYYDTYKKMFESYKNVEVKKYKNIRKYLYKINMLDLYNKVQLKDFDATVFIGGSIFMEENNKGRNYDEKIGIINYFNEGKEVFILGSNFGPYINSGFKDKFEMIFNNCTDVCFRENYSYDLFKKSNKIRKAPDIVFQLRPKKIEKRKNTIGISLIDLEKRNELSKYREDYIEKIREIIIKGINKGKEFLLFSFSEIQGDLKIINDVINPLNNEYKEKIETVNYNGDIDVFLEKFESAEDIIGTRFHACILSQVFNQGLYPIIYSNKTYNVLEDIDLCDYYTYLKDINRLDVDKLFNIIKDNKVKEDWIFKESEKQFEVLDRYVRG